MAVELSKYDCGITFPDDDDLESRDQVIKALYDDHLADSFDELKQRLEDRDCYDSNLVSKHRPHKDREKLCLFCYSRVTVGHNGKEFGHHRRLERTKHGFYWDSCPFICARNRGDSL